MVVEFFVPGARVIVVVVCVSGAVVTTGGVTWTIGGGVGTVSTSLVVSEKQPATINATDVVMAGHKMREQIHHVQIYIGVDLNGDFIHSVPDVRPPHRKAVAEALIGSLTA